MTAHSHIGASSMYRWANCPGSVSRCRDIPRSSSFAAAEGTVAHGIAEDVLRRGGYEAMMTCPSVVEQDGHKVEVTQEMLDAVALYVRTVNDERLPGDTLLIEHGFHLKDLHPDLFGTADCVIWCPSMKLLTVMDYKHGAGIPVEVAGNPQLKYYALGALLTAGFPATRVRVVIVQPRCPHADGPVRADEFDAIDLLDFRAELLEAVKRTEDPNAPLKVGDWCKFCPALAVCEAQRKEAQALAKVAFTAPTKPPREPATLAPFELTNVLDRAPIFEAWIKAVREYAYQQAEDGNPPPGYKLVDKVARRKIRDDADLEAMAKLAHVATDDLYEKKVKGVTDLEKMMPGKNAKARAEALTPFVTKESTGHALVHESDKRPAVVRDPQAAAKLAFQPE